MHVAPAMVSANEAAALAMVEVRDVYRAFDEHLLPEALLGSTGGGRQIARGAVPLLAFYFRTAHLLQADARKAVIRLVASGGRTGALRRVAALRRRRHPLPVGDGGHGGPPALHHGNGRTDGAAGAGARHGRARP